MVRKRTSPHIHLLQLLLKLDATPSDLTTTFKSVPQGRLVQSEDTTIFADAKE